MKMNFLWFVSSSVEEINTKKNSLLKNSTINFHSNFIIFTKNQKMNNLFPIFPIYNNICLFPYNISGWPYVPQFPFSLQTFNENQNLLNVAAAAQAA